LSAVVADDDARARRDIATALRARGHRVVAEAQSGDEATTIAAQLRPDVVVLDIRMPPTFTDEGLRAAEAIGSRAPGVAVVVLSQYLEATWAIRLLDRRTRGTAYLLKDRIADLDVLDGALRTVANGGSVVDDTIVERLLRRSSVALEGLSDRERGVLALMAEGHANQAIARDLHISNKTCESHVRSIFRKLDLPADGAVHRRVHAVLKYLQDAG
jgi:DNA-binding NarL/FixJ family response regulator